MGGLREEYQVCGGDLSAHLCTIFYCSWKLTNPPRLCSFNWDSWIYVQACGCGKHFSCHVCHRQMVKLLHHLHAVCPIAFWWLCYIWHRWKTVRHSHNVGHSGILCASETSTSYSSWDFSLFLTDLRGPKEAWGNRRWCAEWAVYASVPPSCDHLRPNPGFLATSQSQLSAWYHHLQYKYCL